MLDRKVVGINRELDDRQLPWLLRWFSKLFGSKE
jgi:hypothetical protein